MPSCRAVRCMASSVDWAVKAWVKTEDYWPAMDELTKRVKEELDQAGIGIPFPQMDINVPLSGVESKFTHSPQI